MEATCKERVKQELENTISDVKKLWDSYCNGEDEHEELGYIWDYGLDFSYVPAGTFNDQHEGYFRWQLSWGGPSDEFRFYTDAEQHLHSIEYWFLDWFDGASIDLSGDDFDLIAEIWETLRDICAVQKALEE